MLKPSEIIGESVGKIAEKCGLARSEVSMALRCTRLLRRDKLMKAYRAGYTLELFVFGLEWCVKNGIPVRRSDRIKAAQKKRD